MFDLKDANLNPRGQYQYLCNLHWGEESVYDYVTMFGDERIEIPEINFFFWAKHKKTGKTESHHFFFQGLWSYIEPQFWQMVEVGTIPKRNSISKIISYLDEYENV